MAQSYVTDAGTLIIPQATATWQVAAENSGLSTSGVVILVGEADAGPDYSLESSLADNMFGPDQISSVLAKYRSGNLVDAYRAVSSPSNDPSIVGAPSRILFVKTNPSVKASALLTKYSGGDYAYLADKSYGKLGNMINYRVEASTSEAVPTTGSFTWINNVADVNLEFRVNGGAAVALSLVANRTPTQFVTAVDALAGVAATGGAARVVIPGVAGNVALSHVANVVTITYTGTWTTTPSVGDTMVIPATSAIKGAGDKNVGAYVVTSATTNSIVATKLSDAAMGGAVGGVVTEPEDVVATPVAALTDLTCYSPVTISLESGNPLDGVGKSLEIAQLATGTDLLEDSCFALSATQVSWISKTGAGYLITSATEYVAKLSINRQSDNVQEELVAGGEIALKLGYTGTSAQVVVNDTTMTITVVDGAGTSIGALNLSDFPTLSDLASFINSKTGYTCSVGSAILGQLSPVNLDDGTFTFATSFGVQTGRLKIDAYRFYRKIFTESVLCQLQDAAGNSGTVEQAASGLPAPTAAVAYLENGAKGSTTAAAVQAAVDALEKVRGNFLVPLFSRDATEDIADGLTESGSTYVVDTVNSLIKAHVLKMSTLKRKRNRQAFISKKDTFTNARSAASNIASFRCSMFFQDAKVSGVQYQPWMTAAIAAGMQAAGFYRPMVAKFANVSGVLQAAGDFDDQDDTAVENALISGLNVLRRAETGGYKWVSDQTTYGKDSNFVFNSIQATYVADLIALTTAARMENAFVGQSVADVSAPLAKAFLESVMSDLLRLKLIAPSDDAPQGFKNITIRISGTSMIVSLEVKLAGAIYFVPVSFLVSQVQQTA